MPKVVSRAAISSSDQATATASSQTILRTFYCLCGEFLLVIDRALDQLPRRRTDGAYIVRCKPGKASDGGGGSEDGMTARKFKLAAVQGSSCLVRRPHEAKLEVRVPLLCSRCNTLVAYQTESGPIGSTDFLYLVTGGFAEQQGTIPPDAFTGEEELLQGEKTTTVTRSTQDLGSSGEIMT